MCTEEPLLTDEEINTALGYNGMKHTYQRRRNLSIAEAQAQKIVKQLEDNWAFEEAEGHAVFSVRLPVWRRLRRKVGLEERRQKVLVPNTLEFMMRTL